VAVGRTYLLPPLSSGGASLVRRGSVSTPAHRTGHADLPHPLSDKRHAFTHDGPDKPCEAYEPEVPVKVREGITPALASPDLCLNWSHRPTAQPCSCRARIGFEGVPTLK